MSDNYKLTYFSLRGRAEPARLLFKLAGKPFDDNRVSGDSWQAFKAGKHVLCCHFHFSYFTSFQSSKNYVTEINIHILL